MAFAQGYRAQDSKSELISAEVPLSLDRGEKSAVKKIGLVCVMVKGRIQALIFKIA